MFKTIEECQLDVVGFSVSRVGPDDDFGGYCDDWMPAKAARASFGKQDKTGENPEADAKLIKYLADHQHMTPFEYQHATFLIECPLFIRSQIHRHRTFSYNEISRRYTSENLEFWKPDNFRKQSKSNKQASTDEIVKPFIIGFDTEAQLRQYEDVYGKVPPTDPAKLYEAATEYSLMQYNRLIEGGVCREQARAVLPQSLLTRFYMGGNLRNWAHFIQLRSDEHAQQEVRVIANRIAEELSRLWPESCKALGIKAGSGEDAEGRARPAR